MTTRTLRPLADIELYVDPNFQTVCIFSTLGLAFSLVLAAFAPSVADAFALLG